MNIVVLGGGESGVGAAILAQKKGHQVFVSDYGVIKEEYKKKMESNAIPYEEGKHTVEQLLQADEVIKSPGIPSTVTIVKRIKEAGIPVIGEIELAYRYLPEESFIIGITGSNGKTTTTLLIHHLLTFAGIEAHLVGNIGFSFAEALAKEQNGVFVLELSSFQLDSIHQFKPDIGVLLNITPDHLDRYDNKMSSYIESKMRLIKNSTASEKFFYNISDSRIANYLWGKNILPKQFPILESLAGSPILDIGSSQFDLNKTVLRGKHNQMNALFAIAVVNQFGISDKQIQDGLESFRNAPHRLESVAIIDGVEFINDSKATNVESVYYALDAIDRPIIWMVGGVDKGNDYSILDQLVTEKVKGIIGLGIDNQKVLNHFYGMSSSMDDARSMEEALKFAKGIAVSGDVVLLSPACASFDLFKNYEDRGKQFKAIVKSMQRA